MNTSNEHSTEYILDQHKINALSAMVIVQLPFPPMPLCVVVGEDNRDGTCSSHDLLARAIAIQYASAIGDSGSAMPSSALTESKTEVLTNLLMELIKLSKTVTNTSIPEHIEAIYQIFQRHFRNYLALYPSTSQDIRFAPLDTVDPKSLIMKQAISHLQALKLQTQDSDASSTANLSVNTSTTSTPHTYHMVLENYFKELTCVLENDETQTF